MSLLNRLERYLGRFAIPNLSLYLVIGQVTFFLLALLGHDYSSLLVFRWDLVLAGDVWRLVTFTIDPPQPTTDALNLFFIVCGWSMFYMMGTALEHYWGAFRYNMFLGSGWLLTVAVMALFPHSNAGTVFIGVSVFLAFAFYNPDFEIYLLFVLPVKIKWFARLTWAGYVAGLLLGNWAVRLLILASVANYFLFLGRDVYQLMRSGHRHMKQQARRVEFHEKDDEPRHRCHKCGKTDFTHPQMEFRYCSKCAGEECYCSEHIANHEHTVNVPKKN